MQKQKAGVIINISTAWAFEPSAMFPTSAVFRAGLASFTKIFADTYAGDNIRMNNVLPGWIDSLPATEERRDSVPMKRYGTSEEIAATIAFLASDGRRLHHRPEHPRRWRGHALDVRSRRRGARSGAPRSARLTCVAVSLHSRCFTHATGDP